MILFNIYSIPCNLIFQKLVFFFVKNGNLSSFPIFKYYYVTTTYISIYCAVALNNSCELKHQFLDIAKFEVISYQPSVSVSPCLKDQQIKMPLLPWEETMTCPYNPAHQITPARMQKHLVSLNTNLDQIYERFYKISNISFAQFPCKS